MSDTNNITESYASGPLYGSSQELLFSGLTTYMRRKYTKDLTGVDIAVLGIPFDLATCFRPGNTLRSGFNSAI